MQFDHYLTHWDLFVELHDISTEELPRRNKLMEEVCEYDQAVLFSTKEHADDEALDVLITSIALCQARGIHSMLDAAAKKLERSTEKYIKQGGYDGVKRSATSTDTKQ